MVFVNKNGNVLGRCNCIFLYFLLFEVEDNTTFSGHAEINFNGLLLRYEVLDILEFTSDRKRMSVVVKCCLSGKIYLLSKGADEAILPLARSGDNFFFTLSVFQSVTGPYCCKLLMQSLG